MPNYEILKREWSRLKSALTRASNAKNWVKVEEVCNDAMRIFDENGYPDDWSLFESANRDAQSKIERGVPNGKDTPW